MKRLLSVILALIMLVSVVCVAPVTSNAATSLPDSLYIQQGYPATCTLAASTMMLRARMYLSSNSAWSSITEDSLLPVAWISGTGLRHSFTYSINGNSVSVAHAYSSGISIASLKALLNSHPEGIVLYCGNLPHAVFVTDYEGDTFYCADSAGSPYSGRRLALASSLLGEKYQWSQANILANVTAYWYVSSYSITAGGMNLNIGDDFYGMIIHQPSWKSIGQADDGNVQLIYENQLTYDHTLWHFSRNSDGTYTITSLLNGKCLDVADASSADRANVQCFDSNGTDAQKWHIYWNVTDSSYYLRANCTSKVMDLDNANTSEGNNIHMYTQNSTDAQKFAVYKLDDSSTLDYTITCENTKLPANSTITATVGGELSYAYNYKFYITDSYSNETVIDNKCNPVLTYTPEKEGVYTIYAEVKNPICTDIGSKAYKSVTVTVGCAHSFSEEFIEAECDNTQGYVLHTCTKCGESYKDGYATLVDGWYYADDISQVCENLVSEIEYNNYYEKEQSTSPGEDWEFEEVVRNEWQNVGSEYTTYIEQTVSDYRVLVNSYYYHWCIPGAGIDTEGNYEATTTHAHYDQISATDGSTYVAWTGDDNGHPVYMLNYNSGSRVYCQTGVGCDGTWGTHSARCKAWYKNYVYQDREKIEINRYVKESGWTNEADASAYSTSCRFKVAEALSSDMLGDADNDFNVSILDSTAIQLFIAKYNPEVFNETLADVDLSGYVDILDATYIQLFIAKLLSVDGIGESIQQSE